jgi:hypothetical protein
MRNAIALATVVTLGLAACGDDPPTPSEVRGRITDDLGNILRETNAAATAMDALPGSAAFAMLDQMFNAQAGTISPEVANKLAAVTALVAPRTDTRTTNRGLLPAEGEDAIDADETIRVLTEEVFTDANETDPGIYTLPPSLVCKETTFDPNGNPIETIDQDCAAQLAKIDLRIKVSEDDGALIFAIQLDANHDEPLVVSLEHTRLAATIDLDETQQAITTLAPVLGEEVPNMALSGAVTGSLSILGPANAQLALAIDRALAIKVADTGIDLDGPQATRITSAAADVLALSLDGNRHVGGLDLGLGATTLHLAEDRALDVDLPGVTAQASFGVGQPLSISHIGLGDRSTTVAVNGQRAITIDLNPQDGRELAATVTADAATGLETLAVTPKLDLRYAVDHAVLGDTRPVYDVTQVLLEGSLRGGGFENDRIEVLSGQLSITTDPTGFGFSAVTGQCVTGTETQDATSGAFYTAWTVGACQ